MTCVCEARVPRSNRDEHWALTGHTGGARWGKVPGRPPKNTLPHVRRPRRSRSRALRHWSTVMSDPCHNGLAEIPPIAGTPVRLSRPTHSGRFFLLFFVCFCSKRPRRVERVSFSTDVVFFHARGRRYYWLRFVSFLLVCQTMSASASWPPDHRLSAPRQGFCMSILELPCRLGLKLVEHTAVNSLPCHAVLDEACPSSSCDVGLTCHEKMTRDHRDTAGVMI